jgi:hypothetical protein
LWRQVHARKDHRWAAVEKFVLEDCLLSSPTEELLVAR